MEKPTKRHYIAEDLLWTRTDVKRFAGVYNRRVEENPTETRVIKQKFFNYILENFGKLQVNEKVRVVPNDAFKWVKDKNDEVFARSYVPKEIEE